MKLSKKSKKEYPVCEYSRYCTECYYDYGRDYCHHQEKKCRNLMLIEKTLRIVEREKNAQPSGEEVTEHEKKKDDDIVEHVSRNYYLMGRASASLKGSEANKIIEEIIQVLLKRKLTVKVAIQLLNDTVESIENEAALNEML